MADLLEQGSTWLEAQRKKHATREVTYRRAADSVLVRRSADTNLPSLTLPSPLLFRCAGTGEGTAESADRLSATVGRTTFEQDDGAGAIVRSQVRDYLIDTADLVLGAAQTLPAKGDRIEEVNGGQKFTYEVMPMGSEPHWRYSDPYRRTLRIHTKHVGTEDV